MAHSTYVAVLPEDVLQAIDKLAVFQRSCHPPHRLRHLKNKHEKTRRINERTEKKSAKSKLNDQKNEQTQHKTKKSNKQKSEPTQTNKTNEHTNRKIEKQKSRKQKKTEKQIIHTHTCKRKKSKQNLN